MLHLKEKKSWKMCPRKPKRFFPPEWYIDSGCYLPLELKKKMEKGQKQSTYYHENWKLKTEEYFKEEPLGQQ